MYLSICLSVWTDIIARSINNARHYQQPTHLLTGGMSLADHRVTDSQTSFHEKDFFPLATSSWILWSRPPSLGGHLFSLCFHPSHTERALASHSSANLWPLLCLACPSCPVDQPEEVKGETDANTNRTVKASEMETALFIPFEKVKSGRFCVWWWRECLIVCQQSHAN